MHTPFSSFSKFTLLAFLFFGTALASCKKDEAPQPVGKKELLSNTWKVSDVKNAEGASVIDLPVAKITCLKDNIFTLNADDSYAIDEGAEICDPSSAGTGTWSLSTDEKELQFSPSQADEPLTFGLLEVTATTLKITYILTNSGIPAADGTYTIILSKS